MNDTAPLTGVRAGAGCSHDRSLVAAAERAATLVHDGARVGLGSGRAAAAFVCRLGVLVRQGLRVTGVPTSAATAALARELGIELAELDGDRELDLTVDGADEVTPTLDLLKGRGGALVRERIVAAASRRQIIVVGPEKLVGALGESGPLPIEVIPFAVGPVRRRLGALGLELVLRRRDGEPVVSDNGNWTIDCTVAAALGDPAAARRLERELRAVPGVVDTGLFLGTAERVIVGYPDGAVDERRRPEPRNDQPAPSGADAKGRTT
jgi:ribose 5-phosphate isomerase A